VFIADKGIQSTGGSHNDVREGVLVLEELDIFLDGCTAIEDGSLHIRQILAEPGIFVLDLIRQFSSVTHHQHRAFARNGLQLMKSSQDEDSSLTETRFGLAENVDAEEGLRNTFLLDCRRPVMLDLV
jgi:hypothetical protein